MNDRISLYPGRVTLTPVAGQANTYDLVRADSPTQEGTPLNKASLLKDTTAALYGLTVSAVPDEVLAAIKPMIDAANANANTKCQIQTGSYVGTGTYGRDNPCSLTFNFAPKLVFIASNKAFWGSSTMPSYSELTFIIDVGVTGYISENYAVATEFNMSNGGKTMTWNNTNNAQGQMNFSEVQYHYVAIG